MEDPDSNSALPQTPNPLGNLINIDSFKASDSCGDQLMDSQETHLSTESLTVPDVATRNTTDGALLLTDEDVSSSNRSPSKESEDPVADFFIDQIKSGENSENNDCSDEPLSKKKKVASDLKGTTETAQTMDLDKSKSDNLQKLKVLEGKIDIISDSVPNSNKCELEQSLAQLKIQVSQELNKIALSNKEQKNQLLVMKKQKKLDKSSLQSLVTCQRKLISLLQSEKELCDRITTKIQQSDYNAVTECSQSLLDCSMLPNFPLPSPQSILKTCATKPSDVLPTTKGNELQKKCVKFNIPYKAQTMVELPKKSTENFETQENHTAVGISDRSQLAQKEISNQSPQNKVTVISKKRFPLSKPYNSHSTKSIDGNIKFVLNESAVYKNTEGIQSDSLGNKNLLTWLMKLPNSGPKHMTEVKNNCPGLQSDVQSMISGTPTMERSLLPKSKTQEVIKNHSNLIKIKTKHKSRTPDNSVIPFTKAEGLLDLREMIKRGKIQPGRNVLEHMGKGHLYIASLLENGNIKGAGGEIFLSPMTWMKALTGCRPIKRRAYKMIKYKGITLYNISMCENSLINVKETLVTIPVISDDTKHNFVDQKRDLSIGKVSTLTEKQKLCSIRLVENCELYRTSDLLLVGFWDQPLNQDTLVHLEYLFLP